MTGIFLNYSSIPNTYSNFLTKIGTPLYTSFTVSIIVLTNTDHGNISDKHGIEKINTDRKM